MYVCVCQGVTDRQIRRAVEQGACSLKDVQQKLPVADCCGRCAPSARELIREQVRAQSIASAEHRYGLDAGEGIGYAAEASCG